LERTLFAQLLIEEIRDLDGCQDMNPLLQTLSRRDWFARTVTSVTNIALGSPRVGFVLESEGE
jgi:hypothetical protein